ncbi:AMP-binding protein, partial [Streptomyces anulatus]|uniref:AMP-binding protein n=1 Tax=Streptomyces anulatus TaxID=1892 RepID=UPI00364FCD2E
MFRRQVVRAPDATAVVAADRTLSYGELDARASAVACGLRDRGGGGGGRRGPPAPPGAGRGVGVGGGGRAGGA